MVMDVADNDEGVSNIVLIWGRPLQIVRDVYELLASVGLRWRGFVDASIDGDDIQAF
jgi:hypothetical protein